MEHCLDHEPFDTVHVRGEEHGGAGAVLGAGALGEDRHGKLFPGPHVDGRNSGAGIVLRVMPGQGVHDIGPEPDLLCCPAHAISYGIVQGLRERDIGREGEVDDRDPRVLAERHIKVLCHVDIL